MSGLIDTTERTWQDHLRQAMHEVAELDRVVSDGASWEAAMAPLASGLYHLTQALAGLTAGPVQVSRWKQDDPAPPAGNVPAEDQVGATHLYPPRAGDPA